MLRKNQKGHTKMGMAASQARLLALTARMHDIELRAQNLEAQKLSLATQEDAAYQKYCDALDATKIQVGQPDPETGKINYVDANYSTVCGFQLYNKLQYSLVNNITGKVIVSPEIKELYDDYGQNDKYVFAWRAMGYAEGQFGWTGGPNPSPWHDGVVDAPDQYGGVHFVGIGNNYNYGIPGTGYPANLDPPAGWGQDLFMTE